MQWPIAMDNTPQLLFCFHLLEIKYSTTLFYFTAHNGMAVSPSPMSNHVQYVIRVDEKRTWIGLFALNVWRARYVTFGHHTRFCSTVHLCTPPPQYSTVHGNLYPCSPPPRRRVMYTRTVLYTSQYSRRSSSRDLKKGRGEVSNPIYTHAHVEVSVCVLMGSDADAPLHRALKTLWLAPDFVKFFFTFFF